MLSALAIAVAGGVLTWEVIGRYFLSIPSDWQDELSTFLLIGATFGSAAWTQARRGHVGIDALAHVLPPGIDRVRRLFADAFSLAFVAFFAWKSWQLLGEAWEEGQTTPSAWGAAAVDPVWLHDRRHGAAIDGPAGAATARQPPRRPGLGEPGVTSTATPFSHGRVPVARAPAAVSTGTIGLLYAGSTLRRRCSPASRSPSRWAAWRRSS